MGGQEADGSAEKWTVGACEETSVVVGQAKFTSVGMCVEASAVTGRCLEIRLGLGRVCECETFVSDSQGDGGE